MFAFSLCLIKITARIDRRQMQKKLTKAKDRNPPITAHTLTSVWPSCFLRGQVCCTDYWQQGCVYATVCLSLNFRTLPHSTLRKKRENKILWSICGKCSFPKNSNWINFRLLNQDWIWILDCSFYEWIIESTNEIIFPLNEFISSLATGMLDLLWL